MNNECDFMLFFMTGSKKALLVQRRMTREARRENCFSLGLTPRKRAIRESPLPMKTGNCADTVRKIKTNFTHRPQNYRIATMLPRMQKDCKL